MGTRREAPSPLSHEIIEPGRGAEITTVNKGDCGCHGGGGRGNESSKRVPQACRAGKLVDAPHARLSRAFPLCFALCYLGCSFVLRFLCRAIPIVVVLYQITMITFLELCFAYCVSSKICLKTCRTAPTRSTARAIVHSNRLLKLLYAH